MSKKKLFVFRTLAVFIPLCLAVCIAEAAYRWHVYRQLSQHILFDDASNTSDIFDRHMGYRYRPNETVDEHVQGPGTGPRHYHTNNQGHVAEVDYPVQKPAGELRIAVIGDSFTAGITNTVRWTTVLEERLNGNRQWRDRWHKTTRVLNLGLAGIGVVQFQDVFEQEAVRFDPDVVIVNLIVDDLRRRRYFRGQPADPGQKEELQNFLRKEVLGPLPWFGMHLESLSLVSVARHLGCRSRLDARHYVNADEAMAVSLASLRKIAHSHPRVLILHQPMYEEFGHGLDSFRANLKKRLYAEGADLHIVRMQELLPNPAELGIDPVTTWYQKPSDPHPTDVGMTLYGEAVEKAVLKLVQP